MNGWIKVISLFIFFKTLRHGDFKKIIFINIEENKLNVLSWYGNEKSHKSTPINYLFPFFKNKNILVSTRIM